MTSTSARTAARPRSPVGWAIAVIGGPVCTNHGMSSKAAIPMSSGTRRPGADGVQCAERHQVVGGEHDLGRFGERQEVLGGAPAAVRLEVALADVGVGQRESVSAHRLTEGLDALVARGGGGGARDDGESAVAQRVQMGDQVLDGPVAVGAYDGDVHAGHPAVHEDHRGAGACHFQQQGRFAVGGRDEEPVDPAVQQGADVVVLLLGPLVGVADDHAVAEGAGLLLDGAGERGEVRVEHVADDQAEGAGLIGAQ